ncbi:hypothetical protein BDA99DRAFT_535752 [Phascolomyces articulosus]|uniref:Uncharacterized protein n=1 Tax=Phascolomyces articulosus TaxID=60185 RepID=A0AAD5K494_9FUNG|nr:hypothetical protein BDA99DRAFT_535752 [Phascolomyces articulosus]
MNVDSIRPIKRKTTKGSFKKGQQKREGLATVDANRIPQQQHQPLYKKPIQRSLSALDNHNVKEKGYYSKQEIFMIRQNLSANLTLAKRRMMAKLSQSKLPQDKQMFEYLTTAQSPSSLEQKQHQQRNKKRNKSRKKKISSSSSSETGWMTTTKGGKLKHHRPRPLMDITTEDLSVVMMEEENNRNRNSSSVLPMMTVEEETRPVLLLPTNNINDNDRMMSMMITPEQENETNMLLPTPPPSQPLQEQEQPLPLFVSPNEEVDAGAENNFIAEIASLDILFGGYQEQDNQHTTMMNDEQDMSVEPNSLCDPSSSPLMPACLREEEEERSSLFVNEWEMSNHAAGLLNDLLYDTTTDVNGLQQDQEKEPIDFWLQNTMMVLSDQEMSDLLEFD